MNSKVPLRFLSNVSECFGKSVQNQNPRNLERLRISQKPQGYHLERLGREYWHVLYMTTSKKHMSAKIIHNNGNVVVSASTNEWALKKHLHCTNDISAYSNLANVLAERCLECGISEVTCHYKVEPDTKIHEFLTVLNDAGVSLVEADVYKHAHPFEKTMSEKPWTKIEKFYE